MGGGVPGLFLTRPGLCITGSAGFEDVDEMKAALATRKGWRAVIGLAMGVVSGAVQGAAWEGIGVPRSAGAVACRVVENMMGKRGGCWSLPYIEG